MAAMFRRASLLGKSSLSSPVDDSRSAGGLSPASNPIWKQYQQQQRQDRVDSNASSFLTGSSQRRKDSDAEPPREQPSSSLAAPIAAGNSTTNHINNNKYSTTNSAAPPPGRPPSITLSFEEDYEVIDGVPEGAPSQHESDVHSLLSTQTGLHAHGRTDSQLSAYGLSPVIRPRRDKASQVLGIPHRRSMEPVPSAKMASRLSTRSATVGYSGPPTIHEGETAPPPPLASLYLVSGLPKSHHAWALADPDSVLGLQHTESAVNKWWRPEVLGSTVSPGAGDPRDGQRSKRRRKVSNARDPGAGIGLNKQDVAKMLSKSLKLSFTREVEIIASTLQPPSTVHCFTFTLPTSNGVTGRSASDLRSSVYTSTTHNGTDYRGDPMLIARPSSTYLGPPLTPAAQEALAAESAQATTYHGVCLTVWSHADEERATAIRRVIERNGRAREAIPPVPSLPHLREAGIITKRSDLSNGTPRSKSRGPWSEGETDAETDGALSESDWEGTARSGNVGGSTLFLPGDTVFWLPYALTLVSRFPIYDLMRDYLTFSWARFSKDVQSHTLQIAKILSFGAPKSGEIIKLDASAKDAEGSLEMICRMPGGLDFGKGLLDVNFQMWPLFTCLSLDNILTICEIALSPTGRILFVSKHPAMLGVAVSTIKYLVELRGWSGITLPAVHTRDAKIYLEDPGPWIVGMAAEARYVVRIAPEVCLVDLDINYVNCTAPPPGAISGKAQREKYRRRLAAAFDSYFHPDYSIPSEFKEAFPAGRFRSVAKIQSRRGASSSVSVESIAPPEWWHWTRVVQAFSEVLQARDKKPSLIKRMTNLRQPRKQAKLTPAELLVQLSLRKRASAFVDARDDLETKIGRLTRRLNFLLTESDLWREKFVTFEQYAEKLSNEATDLRGKIGKEQRESKRLTSLVTMTAQEKAKLANQLADTEGAHRAAVEELERMKTTMEKMEEERAFMVAEVEAQIERALASMMLGTESDEAEEWDEEQLEEIPNSPHPSAAASSSVMPKPRSRAPSATRNGSRPHSPRSVTSNKSRSRPSTSQGQHTIRSFGTASTLAEIVDRVENVQKQLKAQKEEGYNTSSGADEEEESPPKVRPTSPKAASTKSGRTASTKSGKHSHGHARRFSAAVPIVESDGSPHEGSMRAIDVNITEKADKIAEKVQQIQHKLESVLANEGATSIIPDMDDSESEDQHVAREPIEEEPVAKPSSRPSSSRRPRSAGKNLRINTPLSPRPRTESTKTAVLVTTPTQANTRIPLPSDSKAVDSTNERAHTPHLRRISSGASISALKGASPTPPASATTQESMSSAGVPIQPTNGVTIRPPSSMTTDNDEDDFQSACSTSPRGEQFGANQLSESDQDAEWARRNNLSRRVSKSEKRQTFGGVEDVLRNDIALVRSRASSVNTGGASDKTVDVVTTTVA